MISRYSGSMKDPKTWPILSQAAEHGMCTPEISPPKTVARQVYLGVENHMVMTECSPTKFINKTNLLELVALCSTTTPGKNWLVHIKNVWCTPAHLKFVFTCTPEISSKGAILCRLDTVYRIVLKVSAILLNVLRHLFLFVACTQNMTSCGQHELINKYFKL